jgi:CRISPR/Cas system-associated exonuclease Cas4 (RecB family)
MTSAEKKGPGRPKKVWTEEELAAKEVAKAEKAAAKAEEKAAAKAIKDAEKAAAKAAAKEEKEAAKAAGVPVAKKPKVPKPKVGAAGGGVAALSTDMPADTATLIAEIKATHDRMSALLALLG